MDKNPNNRSFTPEDERRMKERSAMRAKEREEKLRLEREKKERQKQTFGKMNTVAMISLIVIVAFSLLFIAANAFGNVTFSNIVDYISGSLTNIEPGAGYPLETGSGTVKNMSMIGDTLIAVRSNEVSVLNKTAKKIASFAHSYSKPMSAVSNGRMLVCDRVTGRYMVINRTECLYESDLSSETYACAISKKGNYAFSLKTEGASCVVSVFDSSNTKMFDFKCSDEYIIGISFSPDGKKIALIGVGAADASLYSKLYVINIKKGELLYSVDFAGESLNSVFYSGRNSIIVVSENAYTIVNQKGEQEKISFGFNTVSRFVSDPDGNFAVVLSKYGSIDSGAVALLNSKGKELFSIDIECKIESIDYDGKTLCIVDTDNYVRTYNRRGKLIGQTKLNTAAQDITVSERYCYALCYGTIVQLDVRTKL